MADAPSFLESTGVDVAKRLAEARVFLTGVHLLQKCVGLLSHPEEDKRRELVQDLHTDFVCDKFDKNGDIFYPHGKTNATMNCPMGIVFPWQQPNSILHAMKGGSMLSDMHWDNIVQVECPKRGIIIFMGDMPHAGHGYLDVNTRVHFYVAFNSSLGGSCIPTDAQGFLFAPLVDISNIAGKVPNLYKRSASRRQMK